VFRLTNKVVTLTIVLLFWGLFNSAYGHETQMSFLNIEKLQQVPSNSSQNMGDKIRTTWHVSAIDLHNSLNLDFDGDAIINGWEIRLNSTKIQRFFW
jgi:hypothetical protein